MSGTRILRPNIFAGSSLSIPGGGAAPDFWSTFTGDDFTGDNDDPLNPVVWTDQGLSDEWLIQSNKANFNQPSMMAAQSISTFKMSEDFSIQLDFDSYTGADDAILRLYVFNAGNVDGAFIGVTHLSSAPQIVGNFKTASSWDSATQVAISSNNGRFRIRRVSSQWYLEYQDGAGGWTSLVDKTQNTDLLSVWLYAESGLGENQSGNVDNFLINSGTVVPPA
jgi:hypothetical protein